MIKVLDLKFQGLDKSIAAFLIDTSAGPILIETGPHSCLPQLESELEKAGVKKEDISHVFLTHIHLDHAGAAWAFAEAGAMIHLHPFGSRHMADPSKLMVSARRIYQDRMDTLWGEMRAIPEKQLLTAEDNEVVSVGNTRVTALHTPGHAVHHIAWQIDDVLFAGDVAGVKIADGPAVPPCPPPDIYLEYWIASINRIRTLDLRSMYLTHYGEVKGNEIPEHLQTLEEMLWDWANWIKPYYEKNADPAAVAPVFQAYADQQLRDAGLSESTIRQYDAANPAWMSVAGLMRYWRKRSSQ
ncbi:MAG: MBL fold metallo-hydrolase [Calditrichia bacterium]